MEINELYFKVGELSEQLKIQDKVLKSLAELIQETRKMLFDHLAQIQNVPDVFKTNNEVEN